METHNGRQDDVQDDVGGAWKLPGLALRDAILAVNQFLVIQVRVIRNLYRLRNCNGLSNKDIWRLSIEGETTSAEELATCMENAWLKWTCGERGLLAQGQMVQTFSAEDTAMILRVIEENKKTNVYVPYP